MTALEQLGQKIDKAGWWMELFRNEKGGLVLRVRNPKIKAHNGVPKIVAQAMFDPAKPNVAVKKLSQDLLLDT
jgi:hypothetical protein